MAKPIKSLELHYPMIPFLINIVILSRPCVYKVPCANFLFAEKFFLLILLFISFGKFLVYGRNLNYGRSELRARFPNFLVGLESLLTQQQTTFATLAEREMQKILAEKHSANTKKSINWVVTTFKGNRFIIYPQFTLF